MHKFLNEWVKYLLQCVRRIIIAVHFRELFAEALQKTDEVGERMRKDGVSVQMKAEIVKRRLLKKVRTNTWIGCCYNYSAKNYEKTHQLQVLSSCFNVSIYNILDWWVPHPERMPGYDHTRQD